MTRNDEVVREVELQSDYAYHVRSAVRLTEEASKFSAEIVVCRDGQEAKADSAIELVMLMGGTGRRFTVRATGSEAELAVAAIEQLFAENFGE